MTLWEGSAVLSPPLLTKRGVNMHKKTSLTTQKIGKVV